MHNAVSRRRVLALFAATGAVAVAGWPTATRARFAWTGTALGADARMVIDGLDRAAAERVVAAAVAEIERLEQVFSLHRPTSELCRLNSDGRIDGASHDLRILVERSLAYWDATDGAFNPAIQPLWQLLSRHFAGASASEGPPANRLAETLRLCDPSRIRRHGQTITLAPGMALTLNGIAQGYITDAIVQLLIDAGLTDILIDLGELRALPGRPWDIAIAGSDRIFVLRDRAVATSAGSGTPLSPDGRWHHLMDPRSGLCPSDLKSITVTARTATEADALSTALYVAAPDARGRIMDRHAEARVVEAVPMPRAAG